MHVLIIDDHLLFAEAIAQTLSHVGAETVAIATCGAEVWASIDQQTPDLVLIDIEHSECDGIGLGSRLVQALPEAKVVALTSVERARTVRQASAAGFHAYLSKDSDPEGFRMALRRVANDDDIVFPDTRLPAVDDPSHGRSADELLAAQLTVRETEVLNLLTQGASSQEIARRLGLSPNTVRTYVQSILSKLQVHSRLEAAAFAVRNGLVSIPA